MIGKLVNQRCKLSAGGPCILARLFAAPITAAVLLPPPPFQRFFMLSGSKAAALLKEWPPATRRNLLLSPHLCAPTECCLIEV